MNRLKPYLAIAVTCALLALVYFMLILPIVDGQRQQSQEIENISEEVVALHQRVNLLSANAAEIEFPADLLWTGVSKTDAERALQENVFGLAHARGLKLTNFSPSKVNLETMRDQFAFEFEGEAQLMSVYGFLADLEKLQPRVAVNQLRLRRQHQIEPDPDDAFVYVQAVIWGFWEGSR